MKKFLIFIGFIFILVSALLISGWYYFGPAGELAEPQIFTIPEKQPDFDMVQSLLDQGFIKNPAGFNFLKTRLAKDKKIQPGGYYLSQDTFAWQVLAKITGKPDLLWLTVTGCPRKEQIGEKLAALLGWTSKEVKDWNSLYSDFKSEYFEGVYYPDTYLIPVTESAGQIARRFIDRFNTQFAPLADKFVAANIKWTTGIKIASLIAREAAGDNDMRLISGIIWNRLDQGMRLQIDSTMQYTLGKRADGSWWGSVDIGEKLKDSPYNTYLYQGLPPTPICSPNINYLEAVINPENTDCLYYLHDSGGQIHCAKTYAGHKQNIQKYL